MKGGQARYSDQELKRTVEEHCLLVCSRPFRDLAGLELRDRPASACLRLPSSGIKGDTPPSFTNFQSRKHPTDLPTGQSDRGIFSTEALSSQMSRLCQVDKNQPKQNANASAQGPALLPGQCGQDTTSCVTGWILSPVLLRAVVVSKHSAN